MVDVIPPELIAFRGISADEQERVGIPPTAVNTDQDGRVGVEINAEQEPIAVADADADSDETVGWMYPSARIGVEPTDRAFQRSAGYSAADHGTLQAVPPAR